MTQPDLITSAEAAAIAGISPSTFRTLTARGQHTKTPVPAPAFTASKGQASLWHRVDIERWAATRDRSRGRPPAST